MFVKSKNLRYPPTISAFTMTGGKIAISGFFFRSAYVSDAPISVAKLPKTRSIMPSPPNRRFDRKHPAKSPKTGARA